MAEVIWTVLPIVTVVALFVLTFRATNAIETSDAQPTVQVEVNAFTWQWSFHYPDGGVTIVGAPDAPPELVVPVGEPSGFAKPGRRVSKTIAVLDCRRRALPPGGDGGARSPQATRDV